MFRKLSSGTLRARVRQAGIHEQVSASRSLDVAAAVIAQRFGDGASLHAKPVYIRKRVLAIEIAHTAVAEQIRQCEEAVISEINTRIGRPEIVRVQFVLPKTVS